MTAKCLELFKPMDQAFTDEDRAALAELLEASQDQIKWTHIEHAIIDDVVGHVLVGSVI